jgi:RNA polymerase sigma-70 factor, ECF subfamily
MSRFGRVLTNAMDDARRRWPHVALDAGPFASFVRERLAGGDEAASIDRLQMLDLYLACACARGLAPATAAFREAYLPHVRSSLRCLDMDAETIDGVAHGLFDELLDRTHGGPPGISRYGGRSSLLAWVLVKATRKALTVRERQGRPSERGSMNAIVADPELARLKVLYRESFHAAFREAARGLSSRERNLLRYRFVERLTIEEVARLYGLERRTALEWQDRACRALIDGTRGRLVTAAAISAGATTVGDAPGAR